MLMTRLSFGIPLTDGYGQRLHDIPLELVNHFRSEEGKSSAVACYTEEEPALVFGVQVADGSAYLDAGQVFKKDPALWRQDYDALLSEQPLPIQDILRALEREPDFHLFAGNF